MKVIVKLLQLKYAAILLLLSLIVVSCKKEEEKSPIYSVNFTYSFANSSSNAPATVNFQNLSTGATSYDWYFGDNSSYEQGVNPSHIFYTQGNYSVTLTAYFPDGNSLSKTMQIEVLAPGLPAASFTTSSDTFSINQSISFTNTSNNAINYNWDFGDGALSAITNPVHSYSNPGTYLVKLKATNSLGQQSIFSKNIVIINVPSGLTSYSINQVLNQYQ